ncbi:MAG: hypothetical protein HUJ31_02390 [Pseudomonadales bacterium]|nr:hypothetical protein [Pseudomonadales bacterium]
MNIRYFLRPRRLHNIHSMNSPRKHNDILSLIVIAALTAWMMLPAVAGATAPF